MSVHKNGLVGRQCLLLDALMDIVGLYLFYFDKSEVPEVDYRCAEIKEKNKNSASFMKLENNLLEVHYKILENLKYKLVPFIEHLLKSPDEKKFIGGSICF